MPVVTEGSNNPAWSEDEIILILYLYKQQSRLVKDNFNLAKIDSKILQIYSSYLINLAKKNGIPVENFKNFRTPYSIVLRMLNFINLDKNIPEKKGLYRMSGLVFLLWEKFKNNPAFLEKEAEQIILFINKPEKLTKTTLLAEKHFSEGGIRLAYHKQRERSAKLVFLKKQKGFLSCDVCGFDFLKFYGKHGENFIECHHNKPLSEMMPNNKTSLSDLSLVCANCHRMIHRKKEYLTIEELKDILKENKSP